MFIKGDPDLPSYYNTRLAFPKCQPMILDQQICGSCWAFSSAGHLEDRFCIHSDAQIKVTLSPQDMINCSFESFGCKGGYLSQAIDFLETEGTSTYQCLPYENHKNACFLGCKDPKMAYQKYYCKSGTLRIETDYAGIQRDIYENGPVMVSLEVYEDLYNYKGGVYEYTTGGLIGGHAIRAVGWGHDDDGHLYWIVQN